MRQGDGADQIDIVGPLVWLTVMMVVAAGWIAILVFRGVMWGGDQLVRALSKKRGHG